jgi:hypothetical protein
VANCWKISAGGPLEMNMLLSRAPRGFVISTANCRGGHRGACAGDRILVRQGIVPVDGKVASGKPLDQSILLAIVPVYRER